MHKKISAILSIRNSKKFIVGCLDNLLHQTAADDLEIVIINSASQENEESIIHKYMEKHSNIKYYKTRRNETLYASWNRAIKMASGKYVINTNTDDRSRPDALEIMAKTLDDNPEIVLVYSNFYVTRVPHDNINSGRKKRHWLSCKVPSYSHMALLTKAYCGPRPMWKRSIHNKIGLFDKRYIVGGDYELWLRIAEKYQMLHIPEFLSLYYINKSTLCGRNSRILLKEHSEIRKKYFKIRAGR